MGDTVNDLLKHLIVGLTFTLTVSAHADNITNERIVNGKDISFSDGRYCKQVNGHDYTCVGPATVQYGGGIPVHPWDGPYLSDPFQGSGQLGQEQLVNSYRQLMGSFSLPANTSITVPVRRVIPSQVSVIEFTNFVHPSGLHCWLNILPANTRRSIQGKIRADIASSGVVGVGAFATLGMALSEVTLDGVPFAEVTSMECMADNAVMGPFIPSMVQVESFVTSMGGVISKGQFAR
jgi:hypothetical protein